MIAPWVIGVLLATLASFVSNLGLTLQKLNHTLNEQRIRTQLREERKKAAAAAAAAAATSGQTADVTFGPTGTKILNEASSYPQAASYQNDPGSGSSTGSGSGGTGGMTRSQSFVNSIFPNSEPTSQVETVALGRSSSGVLTKPAYPSVLPPSQQPQALTPAQQANLEAYSQLQTINYSRQTMWRAGLGLVTLGSVLDFVALIFAPQSLIAPLGSLTLVSNTFLAPILLGETVSTRDLFATGGIVFGSIIAVVFADHGDAMFTHEELFRFFETKRTGLYALIVILVLFGLYQWKRYLTSLRLTEPRRYSRGSYAAYHRFTYSSLAGIVGAQSVLFAKCFGQLLVDWFAGADVLAYFQTYVIILGLVLTIFLQISWLNSGLKLFESLYVVPVFQSFWILVSVTGGMIVFQEYQHVFDDSRSGVFFPLGVIVTIAGVYVLSQRGGLSNGGKDGGGRDPTPRTTPIQRNYRHFIRPTLNTYTTQGEQIGTIYGRAIQPSVQGSQHVYDSFQASSDAPTTAAATASAVPAGELTRTYSPPLSDVALGGQTIGPAGGNADQEEWDGEEDEIDTHSFVSPAPPITFMSGPFLDTRYAASTAVPSYLIAASPRTVQLYHHHQQQQQQQQLLQQHQDPERARLIPTSSSLPPRIPTAVVRDSIDSRDIVDEPSISPAPVAASSSVPLAQTHKQKNQLRR